MEKSRTFLELSVPVHSEAQLIQAWKKCCRYVRRPNITTVNFIVNMVQRRSIYAVSNFVAFAEIVQEFQIVVYSFRLCDLERTTRVTKKLFREDKEYAALFLRGTYGSLYHEIGNLAHRIYSSCKNYDAK